MARDWHALWIPWQPVSRPVGKMYQLVALYIFQGDNARSRSA